MDLEFAENIQVLEIAGGPMGKSGAIKITDLPISKIKLARNSRRNIADEELAGMMQSIKEVGLLQPIGVVKSSAGYEICYGNRRFLACSKLGYKRIPAVIHTNKTDVETDLQNLTENLQRRNITLAEAGRYMNILNGAGLSMAEIGVRLGVSKSYVDSCLSAFREVPEKYRDDLVVRNTGDKTRTPGKISIAVGTAIVNTAKTHGLDSEQIDYLFKSAKRDDRFNKESLRSYAMALKAGKKDPIKETDPVVSLTCRFLMKQSVKEKLEEKFVIEGPFKSVNGLIAAILRGEKAVKIDVL